jgi:hypothetical protein
LTSSFTFFESMNLVTALQIGFYKKPYKLAFTKSPTNWLLQKALQISR